MLFLQKITLNNFMKISHAEIDLSHVVTSIYGMNGHGKSSLIDALAVCLLEYKRGDSYKEYVKKGTKKASIYLEALIGTDPILFDIEITANTSTITRKVTYKNRVYNNSEVGTLLTELELNYYGNIIFSMQDSDNIAKKTPAQLAEYLQKLLSFDFSDKIIKIDDNITEQQTQYNTNQNKIDFNTKSIIDRKNEIKNERPLPFSKRQYDGYCIQQTEVEKEIKEFETKTLEMIEVNERFASAQMKYWQVNNDIKDLKQTYDNIKNAFNKITELETEKTSIETELSTIKKIDSNKQLYEQKLSSIESELKQLKEDEIINREQQKEIEINQKHIREYIDLIKQDKCPTCGRDFKNVDIEEYTKKDNTLTYELNTIVEKIKKDLYDYETLLVHQKENKELIQKEELLIKQQEQQIIVLQQKINNIDSLIKAQNEITNTITFKELESQINEKQKSIPELEKTIKENQVILEGFDKTQIEILENKANEIKLKVNSYNTIIQENLAIIQQNQVVQNAIIKMEKEIEELKAKNIDIDSQINLYKEAKDILNKKLPAFLVMKTCKQLEIEMNAFIQIIFPDMGVQLYLDKKGVQFYYSQELNKLKDWTKDDLLNIKMASGFEKAMLSIAFKIALCKAYALPLLILDECDSAASDKNSEQLFDAILNNSIFDQIIIITHKPSVNDLISTIANNYKPYLVENGHFIEE